MSLSGRSARRAVVGLIGSGALAGATLIGGAALAFAQPPPAPTAGRLVARRLIWPRCQGLSGRRWGTICSPTRMSTTSSPAFVGCQTKRSAATSRAIWTPTARSSPRSTGFANP